MLTGKRESDVKRRLFGQNKNWSANRKHLRTKAEDLSDLLGNIGIKSKLVRFNKWTQLENREPAIVGVNEYQRNKYHWVLAVRWNNKIMIVDPEYGEVYDLKNWKEDYCPRIDEEIVVCKNLLINEFRIKP